MKNLPEFRTVTSKIYTMSISNFKINDWGCDPLGHIWHRFIICISQFMTFLKN